MIAVQIQVEDCTIQAKYDGSLWKGTACDNLTGKEQDFSWPGDVLAAALALALNPDGESLGTEQAYKLVEPYFKDWTKEVRFIP